MMLACWMCSFPGFPWAVQFEHPEHVYYAWAIVIISLILAVLPFVLGYRLGPTIPYSVKNHFKFFVLFAVVLLGMGSISFGGSLAILLSMIELFLLAVTLDACSSFGCLAILPGIIVIHAIYTWIFALIDRPLIKPEKTKPERDMKNGKNE